VYVNFYQYHFFVIASCLLVSRWQPKQKKLFHKKKITWQYQKLLLIFLFLLIFPGFLFLHTLLVYFYCSMLLYLCVLYFIYFLVTYYCYTFYFLHLNFQEAPRWCNQQCWIHWLAHKTLVYIHQHQIQWTCVIKKKMKEKKSMRKDKLYFHGKCKEVYGFFVCLFCLCLWFST
jgi:hypothetical protein